MSTGDAATSDTDSHLWLEDVTGKAAPDWVKERNQSTRMRSPAYEFLCRRLSSKRLGAQVGEGALQ